MRSCLAVGRKLFTNLEIEFTQHYLINPQGSQPYCQWHLGKINIGKVVVEALEQPAEGEEVLEVTLTLLLEVEVEVGVVDPWRKLYLECLGRTTPSMPRCPTQGSPAMARWREASMQTQAQNARYDHFGKPGHILERFNFWEL